MTTTTNDSANESSALEINVFSAIRRRWEYVLFGLCLGVGLALLYHFTATPMYESNIEILVGQRSSELTNSGTMTGANASGDDIQEDQLATHMRLISGRLMLADAIEKGGLKNLDSFRRAISDGANPIDYLLKNLVIKRGGEGTARDAMVLRATFKDPSPEAAAQVLASVYESYRDYVESHSQNTSEQAVELIDEARKTHEIELANADTEYREFIQAVPILLDGEKVQDIHKDRMIKLESELNLVRNNLAEQESRLEVIESYLTEQGEAKLGDMDHLALLSQKEVERLKLFLDMTRGEATSEAFQAEQPIRAEAARTQYNRLLELIQKERSLSDAFGAGHPLVEAVRKEIEITQQFMESNAPEAANVAAKKLDPAELLETYTMLLRNDISELEKRKSILMRDSEAELIEAKLVENQFMKGNSLRARLTRAQNRYDQVILRLQELNLSKSYAGFSTDLLASPEVANKQSWPKLPIIGALGVFLGVGLGVVMALVADMLDSTFTNVEDLERSIGATVIAHVPRFDLKKLRGDVSPDSNVSPSLLAFHSPRSAESEIYRVARTSLLVSNRREAVRTIMNTSPQPGDGKSTTISNLAVSFARTGKRVLLIDADLRRPVISKLFGINDGAGLADFLTAKCKFTEAITQSELPNLFIMPNGIATSQPAELLESHRFEAMLKHAKEHFDLILIDAPPLLAVTDPAIIAPLVDSVLLTLRINKNGRRPVELAVKILHDIDVTPTAVIVNGVEGRANKSYSYGAYKGDGYGYVGHYHNNYSARSVDSAKDVTVGSIRPR